MSRARGDDAGLARSANGMVVAIRLSNRYCFGIMNSAAGPSETRAAYVLARINAGLATQWSQIAELAAWLERMLVDARALAEPHIPPARRADWDGAWGDLRETFITIRSLDAEAQKRFSADDPSSHPLEPWSDALDHEQEFRDQLAATRSIGAAAVPASDRSTWEDLCAAIELRIATLNAHALAVRFQLELRQKYGTQKADALTKEIAGRLPKDANIADADKYAAEYRKAAQEFEREQTTFGGVWDFLKALMLIQPKTPEERVRDKYLHKHRQRFETFRE